MREEQNHPREFMELDNRFHAEIAGAARNALYLSLSNTIQSLVSIWYPRRSVLEPTKAATLEEHAAIAAAIQANIQSAARDAMRHHLLCAAKRLQKVLDVRGADEPGRDKSGGRRREPDPRAEPGRPHA